MELLTVRTIQICIFFEIFRNYIPGKICDSFVVVSHYEDFYPINHCGCSKTDGQLRVKSQ